MKTTADYLRGRRDAEQFAAVYRFKNVHFADIAATNEAAVIAGPVTPAYLFGLTSAGCPLVDLDDALIVVGRPLNDVPAAIPASEWGLGRLYPPNWRVEPSADTYVFG